MILTKTYEYTCIVCGSNDENCGHGAGHYNPDKTSCSNCIYWATTPLQYPTGNCMMHEQPTSFTNSCYYFKERKVD